MESRERSTQTVDTVHVADRQSPEEFYHEYILNRILNSHIVGLNLLSPEAETIVGKKAGMAAVEITQHVMGDISDVIIQLKGTIKRLEAKVKSLEIEIPELKSELRDMTDLAEPTKAVHLRQRALRLTSANKKTHGKQKALKLLEAENHILKAEIKTLERHLEERSN